MRYCIDFVSFLLLALVFQSCEKAIHIDFQDNEPKVVINSQFSPNNNFRVHISKSYATDYSSGDIFFNDVKADLYCNDEFLETLIYAEGGYYKSVNSRPVMGKNYRIEVISDNAPYAYAMDSIPEPVEIISIETKSDTSRITCFLELTDPGMITNYYHLCVKTDLSPDYFNILSLKVYDPIILEVDSYGYFFSDNAFNGKKYILTFSIEDYILEVINTNKVYVYLNSISGNYFLYAQSFLKYERNAVNPFIVPISVHTNVEGGFGIFAGFSSSIDSIMIN